MNLGSSFTVPVDGGELFVRQWGEEGPVVLAAHGITASSACWPRLAESFGRPVRLVAPDLRGRGLSGELPGPYGMSVHANDLVAVLDHFDVERSVVAGHSMGGFVSVVMADNHPDRVESLVLVDGGLPLPIPEGISIDDLLLAVIGAAMARLSMTFPSREAYHDFWRVHPALADDFDEYLEAYIDADLTGTEPDLRSRVSADAVRADADDTLKDDTVARAVASMSRPAVLLRAERGLMNEDTPLYTDALAEGYPSVIDKGVVDGTNHYTIVLGVTGAKAVAAEIETALAAAGT